MSACYFVRGLMEPTEDYKKKYAAFKACEEAGIEIPQPLWDYFGNDVPYAEGSSTPVQYEKKTEPGSITFSVDVKSLNPQITKLLFIVGY